MLSILKFGALSIFSLEKISIMVWDFLNHKLITNNLYKMEVYKIINSGYNYIVIDIFCKVVEN